MSSERWKMRPLPSLRTSSNASNQYEPLVDGQDKDTVENKKPRVLTKALRSLSSSSLDSISSTGPRRSMSIRRLQKSQSGSGSMMDRLHKRVSRDSTMGSPPMDGSPVPKELPYSSMNIIRSGTLKPDVSLLKARSEYLVLTEQCLVKFSSIEAALSAFPQLSQSDDTLSRSPSLNHKSGASEVRLEIPLRSVVTVFNEEGASPRFGLEIWWFSPWPRLSYSKAHLYFNAPKERDTWLTELQRAYRARIRGVPTQSVIPENLRARINRIVDTTEPTPTEGGTQNLTFPVARRVIGSSQKPGAAEESHYLADSPSFFFVIGPCMCYLIEVLRADHSTFAGDLRVKCRSFGTVNLTRFRASVASQEQRFVMHFRSPFGGDVRLDLASAHYRRIIEALTKVDRIIKPMWPQNLQQSLFDIKGLPPPLTLTSGNDLGGLERSLQAHCAAFSVPPPRWLIEWPTSSQAAFRLLPPEGSNYSTLQLLAVFRSLRYNNYFKALSFRNVDLSPLTEKHDNAEENIVYTSKTGRSISDEHQAELARLPLLSQEMHNVIFASDSIRSIDLTNVMGQEDVPVRSVKPQTQETKSIQTSSEILRPILMLLRRQGSICSSICISNNPLHPAEVDDLANVLVLDHVGIKRLELSNCGLGNAGLSKLWTGIGGQASKLEVLDTSNNQGIVQADVVRHSLGQLRLLRKLRLAGNTRTYADSPLFDQAAIYRWPLEELDLSGIALNDATIDVLADYLQTTASLNLRCIQLNKCGLTGRQIARLFRHMGQARQLTIHLNANRLDEGIDDLCGAIACGFGPWSLFMQMVEFSHEDSYTKLWRALTVNKTIECLSLAGSATPDDASDTACQAVSDFFKKNETVRYLDISGYDAKLDEGRLGREFSKSLSGIRKNTRIEHLRVRSQMLNINIGDLAEAISGNRVLHTIDCESNDFNLSNFRHLIKHVEGNPKIRYFSAFSEQELSKAIGKSVDDAGSAVSAPKRRSSVLSRLRHERLQPMSEDPLVGHLKAEWDVAVRQLENVLERNRIAFETAELEHEDFDPRSTEMDAVDGAFALDFGGLALREHESRRAKSPRVTADADQTPTIDIAALALTGRVSRSQSMVSSDAALSPVTDGGSFGSGIPTPPELESPDGREYHSEGAQSPELTGDDSNYLYYHGGQEQDPGLQMKSHRRFLGDAANRIVEEDTSIGADKEAA